MSLNLDIDSLPPEQAEAALTRLEAIKAQRAVENALAHYVPYPRQMQFHKAGATHRERLLIAANQSGKSLAGGMECAMHATGRYPDWWLGRRFDAPTVGWGAGTTNETTRDTVQRILVGRSGQHGTGSIPKDAILELVPARGTPDLLDSIKVRHVSGGVSAIGLKSYQRGRESFQGETLDYLWFDEEPPADIYTEGLTRTNVNQGPVWVTFTPLLGMSEVVRRFLLEASASRSVVTMTLDDVQHYSAEEKEQIAASYAAHEREARTKGIPTLGSGRIFPVAEEMLACEQPDFPSHWPRIGGMDFGWDHPFAAVELVWDRDTDTVYVSKCYRIREETAVIHAAALKLWGNRLPWAWPRDGRRETLEGAGKPLADQYRAQGLEMLHQHAQFEDGSVSVEAGLQDMLIRMETGRFKVLKHLNEWFEEFRLYHRKDGKVHKEGDDLMCLHGDTMVQTAEGPRRIAALVGTRGKVVTVGGKLVDYFDCRKTRTDAEIVRVDLADGTSIRCTPDHLFLTNAGWIEARNLKGYTCRKSSMPTPKFLMAAPIPVSADTFVRGARFSIAMFGSIIAGQFRRVITFITATAMERIIRSRTWSPSRRSNTCPTINAGMAAAPWPPLPPLLNGTRLRRELLSIGRWVGATLTSCASRARWRADSVGKLLSATLTAPFAAMPASPRGGAPPAWTTWSGPAPSAERPLGSTNTAIPKPVPENAAAALAPNEGAVCLNVERAGRADTYCMAVPATQALAVDGGVIVHNCATRYAVMMLRYAETSRPLRRPEPDWRVSWLTM